MVTFCQPVPDIVTRVYRFVPGVDCLFSNEFLFRCGKSLLHHPVKVTIHDMINDVLRSHASIHMVVEGVH